ncbi:phage major capsid protein [Neobacillus sp. MER 74]|uniref:phage major capsid protein n=1 Tax=Neobacillus sp. MER 74 TaxID=2939566 RepID=UPI0020414497|nr:phage major capsid protein [Neobacillus sp. MER 74]MCM3115470.1 phage major capsid protein [Neobacillus sp. MER 74]
MELRFNESEFKTNDDGSLTVSGYVNKTEQFSELLGKSQKFKEKIAKGAFTNAIRKAKEVHFLAEHDSEKILASTRNDSLQLTEDEQGLYMTATISATSWGKDYYELIKSGILRNMSFGFRAVKDSWRNMGDYFERTVTELDLFEVSVVRDPAYANSTISARGINLVENIEIPKAQEVVEVKEMNKKALIEKRNELLNELEEIAEVVEVESRGLTTDEAIRTSNLKSEIEILNTKIEEKEVRNMIEILNPNETSVEQRGFEAFLKGNLFSDEVRAITTSATPGSLTVPTSISDEIVRKLEEVAPLFGLSKKFPSMSGYLEILKETDIGTAQWLGEMTNATPADFAMVKVKLQQKRLTAAIELSQQLINDAAFDIVNYAVDVLARRIALSLNRAIANGNGTTEMEGFLTATLDASATIQTGAVGSVTTDDVLGLFNSMNPQLVEDAVFVMNRSTFNTLAKLKDGTNNYYLVDFKNGNGAKYYTMMGLPVQIVDVMPNIATGNKAVGLVNFGQAYGTLIKKGIEIQHVYADSTQALRGSQLIVASIYLDGKVISDQSIRLLQVK